MTEETAEPANVSTKVDNRGDRVTELADLALAAGAEEPRDALNAVVRLRRATDRREAMVVRRARVAGMSWAEIATILGVSRQAVHKKYGRS